MVPALKPPWRAGGLIGSALTLFLISQSIWPVALLEALTFAIGLLLGARIRVLLWLVSDQGGMPPSGGEWGSALCAVAIWFAAWTLADPRDRVIEVATAMAVAHGLAKIGCARLGCCGWRAWSLTRGQLLDAALLLLVAALSGYFSGPIDGRWVFGCVAISALILLRILSMIAQSRSPLERGTVALLSIELLAIPLRQ